jgi:dTDP-4-dehydrorhamnose reductase
MELTDAVALEKVFSEIRPDLVVHLAAMADVNACEREPAAATAVNLSSTAEIVKHCQFYGARLLFVSTEYVFDGNWGFYREDAIPNPATYYGRTKWEAERVVANLDAAGAVLRTSLVYGWTGPGRRNFVPYLVKRLQRGETYRGDTGVMRSPIYVEHLADSIARLVEVFHHGIHHVAGNNWVSMYDFARAVAAEFGLEPGLIAPAEGNRDVPDRLGLDCEQTVQRLGLEHYGLAEGLAAMRAAAGKSG